jgi:CubicO group peptidase (beta-lactamase class C family)
MVAGWASVGAVAEPWPTTAWPVSTPQAQGVDPAALAGLYRALAASGARIDSVLVVRHGHIVSEAYFPPYRVGLPHDLRSVTKTVIGTLVGVALERGDLRTTEQRVLQFFPAHEPSDPRQAAITLDHLLQMRTGIQWREWPYDSRSDVMRMAASPDWVAYILERPMSGNPGAEYHYVGAAPHLLSAVLSRATGQSAAAYAAAELFGPLGIRQWSWLKDPTGISIGESSLSLLPRDLAKIGYLHLRDGVWQGRRLLPAGWTRSLFTQAESHGLRTSGRLPPRYRQLWWVDDAVPMAIASGRHGQHLVILPRHDAILVLTGKTNDRSPAAIRISELVKTHLLAALHAAPLSASASANRELHETVARATAPTVLRGIPPPALARTVSGQRYVFARNRLDIRSIRVDFARSGPSRFTVAWRSRTWLRREVPLMRPFGADGRFVTSEATRWGVFASRGAWLDGKTLLIQTEILESSTTTNMKLRFDGDVLELTITDNDGAQTRLRGMRERRLFAVASTGRCNTSLKSFLGRFES